MEVREYGLAISLDAGLAAAEEQVRAALAAEGFGIIAEIDVAAVLKERAGIDRLPYKILGACNPLLASRALDAEPEIGALLPCNVAIYSAAAGGTIVVAIDPGTMAQLSSNSTVADVAGEARDRISRALLKLEA